MKGYVSVWRPVRGNYFVTWRSSSSEFIESSDFLGKHGNELVGTWGGDAFDKICRYVTHVDRDKTITKEDVDEYLEN